MHILVTYDVDTTSKEGARRLRHVAKACIDYGQRVQNSVFECEVTEAQYCLLIERIKRIIDMSLDSVRFYILNKNENKKGKSDRCWKLLTKLIMLLSYNLCECEYYEKSSIFAPLNN